MCVQTELSVVRYSSRLFKLVNPLPVARTAPCLSGVAATAPQPPLQRLACLHNLQHILVKSGSRTSYGPRQFNIHKYKHTCIPRAGFDTGTTPAAYGQTKAMGLRNLQITQFIVPFVSS